MGPCISKYSTLHSVSNNKIKIHNSYIKNSKLPEIKVQEIEDLKSISNKIECERENSTKLRDNALPKQVFDVNYKKIPNQKYQNNINNKKINGLVGLSNLGNTCFLNAAIQCLSNIQPLTDYFLNGIHKLELNTANPLGSKGKILQNYASLIEKIWCSHENPFIAPTEFLYCISELYPQFGNGTQQDAHEFLAFLLDMLHEDLNRVTKKPYVTEEEDEKMDKFSLEKQAAHAWRNYLLRNKSIIVDLFQGQLKSTLKCLVCKYTTNKFESFMYLSVPVLDDNDANSHYSVDLADCIKEFTKEEKLDHDEKWFCPKCQKFQISTKKIDIWKCPNILVVHLKRFKYTRHKRGKIRSKVKIPITDFNMEHLIAGKQKENPNFDLFAVCNHEGTLGTGHYTTVAKNRENNQWYLYNDIEVVKILDQDKINTRENYLLFYSKTSVEDFKRQTLTHPELWPHIQDLSQKGDQNELKKKYLHSLHVQESNIKATKPKLFDSKLGIKNNLHKNVEQNENISSQNENLINMGTVDISELINKKKPKINELPLINEHKKVLKPAIFVLDKNTKFNMMKIEDRKKLISSATSRNLNNKNNSSYQLLQNEEDSLDFALQSCDNRQIETPNIFKFKIKKNKKKLRTNTININCYSTPNIQ